MQLQSFLLVCSIATVYPTRDIISGVFQNLIPGNKKPGSTRNKPKPSYGAPKPSYAAPKPSYGAPKPSGARPKPSYSAPKPSYGAPSGAEVQKIFFFLSSRYNCAIFSAAFKKF